MNFLILFIVISVINVIMSTARSIITINGNKLWASLSNGIYFAYYNIVLLYTVADFSMWQKCVITFVCNVIGVYVVKYVEEKMRKDRLWKIEASVKPYALDSLKNALIEADIPFNYININRYVIFNIYSENQATSIKVKRILNEHGAKFFVAEDKGL